jgi:hypothetical protein
MALKLAAAAGLLLLVGRRAARFDRQDGQRCRSTLIRGGIGSSGARSGAAAPQGTASPRNSQRRRPRPSLGQGDAATDQPRPACRSASAARRTTTYRPSTAQVSGRARARGAVWGAAAGGFRGANHRALAFMKSGAAAVRLLAPHRQMSSRCRCRPRRVRDGHHQRRSGQAAGGEKPEPGSRVLQALKGGCPSSWARFGPLPPARASLFVANARTGSCVSSIIRCLRHCCPAEAGRLPPWTQRVQQELHLLRAQVPSRLRYRLWPR